MNRIDKKFRELREAGRKGFVGYLTAGDPDIAASERNIRAAIDNGLDVLELGMPFSDPTADGPTIQAASHRALAGGIKLSDVLAMVSRIRADYEVPIVLFGYANPLFKYGYGKLCKDASDAGVDGLLIVDIPFEESGEVAGHISEHSMHLVPLIAPTTSEERASMVLEKAGGFVYYIMVTGVTGERAEVARDVDDHIAALRRCTDLPIAAGFGVSSGEQAKQAAKSADAVVVGSALVKAALNGDVEALVKEIRESLDSLQDAV